MSTLFASCKGRVLRWLGGFICPSLSLSLCGAFSGCVMVFVVPLRGLLGVTLLSYKTAPCVLCPCAAFRAVIVLLLVVSVNRVFSAFAVRVVASSVACFMMLPNNRPLCPFTAALVVLFVFALCSALNAPFCALGCL